MAFQPGQSGNPEGGAKIKRFYAALDRAIVQEDSKRLREAAEKLLTLASEGEPWAVQMLADRLDGKPKQQIEASGPDGGPLRTRIEQVIVDPAQK